MVTVAGMSSPPLVSAAMAAVAAAHALTTNSQLPPPQLSLTHKRTRPRMPSLSPHNRSYGTATIERRSLQPMAIRATRHASQATTKKRRAI